MDSVMNNDSYENNVGKLVVQFSPLDIAVVLSVYVGLILFTAIWCCCTVWRSTEPPSTLFTENDQNVLDIEMLQPPISDESNSGQQQRRPRFSDDNTTTDGGNDDKRHDTRTPSGSGEVATERDIGGTIDSNTYAIYDFHADMRGTRNVGEDSGVSSNFGTVIYLNSSKDDGNASTANEDIKSNNGEDTVNEVDVDSFSKCETVSQASGSTAGVVLHKAPTSSTTVP